MKENCPSTSLYIVAGAYVALRALTAVRHPHRGLEGVVLHSRVCPRSRLGELLEEAIGKWASQLEEEDD